jgi:hypothetical protein
MLNIPLTHRTVGYSCCIAHLHEILTKDLAGSLFFVHQALWRLPAGPVTGQ